MYGGSSEEVGAGHTGRDVLRFKLYAGPIAETVSKRSSRLMQVVHQGEG